MSTVITRSTPATLEEALKGAGLNTGSVTLADLANGVLAAYTAYANGTQPSLDGYIWQESIYVQETAADAASKGERLPPPGVTWGPPWQGNTLFGFAACSSDYSHNLIALRGTVTTEEAGYDLYGWGTNTPCLLPSGSSNPQTYGNVKEDLYNFYTATDAGFYISMGASFNAAVQSIAAANPGKPWYIAAHSLGGALATLAALDAVVSNSYGNPSVPPVLVTFGSLHLGDQSFVDAYGYNVPTFRFANLCDFVPSLVSLEPGTTTDPYEHVGLECTFVWQTWDDWGNHSMQNIYLPVVQNYLDVIKLGPRQYPQ